MKIQGSISRKEWDVILDTINEFPENPEPLLDLKEMYHNSLAKYRVPGLFKE